MSKVNVKRPNATKHAVFAATAILPGENPEEFAELHRRLIDEWQPDGATEEEAVLSIATAVWRKRRAQKFVEARIWKKFIDPDRFIVSLETAGDCRTLCRHIIQRTNLGDMASQVLQPRMVNDLEERYPRSKYNSTAERVQAISAEIVGVLLPRYARTMERPASDMIALTLSATTVTDEVFAQEIALDERLDAMLDRLVKRLIQIKAMKKMLAETGAMRATGRVHRRERRQPGISAAKAAKEISGPITDGGVNKALLKNNV